MDFYPNNRQKILCQGVHTKDTNNAPGASDNGDTYFHTQVVDCIQDFPLSTNSSHWLVVTDVLEKMDAAFTHDHM